MVRWLLKLAISFLQIPCKNHGFNEVGATAKRRGLTRSWRVPAMCKGVSQIVKRPNGKV